MKNVSTIIANRVHSASHSSIEWDVRITDRPLLITSKIQFQRNLLAPGSMPVVGSSCKIRYIEEMLFFKIEEVIKPNKCMIAFISNALTKNTTDGFPTRAIAVDNFLLFPPEYVSDILSA